MRTDLTIDLGRYGEFDLTPYLASVAVGPDDIVLASGTLLEGLGNGYSDIDVYIFSHRYKKPADLMVDKYFRTISVTREILHANNDDDVLLVHLPVPGRGFKIDIEFKTFSDLATLSATLNQLHGYAIANHILLTKTIEERSMSLIHRMHTGRYVVNAAGGESLRAGLDLLKYRYLLYRWNASDYADLLDLVGAWQAGEFTRGSDLARENLIKQTLAYLCLVGCTDHKRKWVLPRVERSALSPAMKSRFAALFSVSDAMDPRQYTRATLDFVDEIHALSGQFFRDQKDAAFPPAERVLAWLADRATHVSHPYERFEIEYRRRAYVSNVGDPTTTLLDMSMTEPA